MNTLENYLDKDMLLVKLNFWTPARSTPEIAHREVEYYISIFVDLKDKFKEVEGIYCTLIDFERVFSDVNVDIEVRTKLSKLLKHKLREQINML
ncbi:hypothetical protein ABT56_19420 [Photobacterium aquae]|uniref:Uncharacterized protein n=1 Tax=Photobacterium aquae TaxID=1195763 RepID=A0A0J1JME4_9GAMM|nr:hypothetical protein [Photobacterium aquae]KLV03302.1 hypothetical protein ABT56_19420 [Photobacterium aquae]